MKLYVTHCSYAKDDTLEDVSTEVTPDRLYIGAKIQGFMQRCKSLGIRYAIFSDLYGIWFSNEKHKWYDLHPDDVSTEQFAKLLDESEIRLREFDIIYFYANYKSSYFHPLYRKLVRELRRRDLKVALISHLSDIE